MIWSWVHFAEITTKQLYDILQLREAVFQLEQHLVYKDLDNVDLHAKHLLGYRQNRLIAYLRIHLNKDVIYISRLLVERSYRGESLGSVMLENTLSHLRENYPNCVIVTLVREEVVNFYSRFGFRIIGEPYYDHGVSVVSLQFNVK